MPGDELSDHRLVNRTPTHAACTDAHSVSAHHTAQSHHFSSREHAWLKVKDLCAKNILSSTRHVSFLAAPDTDNQHKFSLTYLSNLAVILFYTPKPVVPRSIKTLRPFTAELWFLGSPISHRSFLFANFGGTESIYQRSRRKISSKFQGRKHCPRHGKIFDNWPRLNVSMSALEKQTLKQGVFNLFEKTRKIH